MNLNAQGKSLRPLPNAHLKMPCGQTAHLLNHWKLMTPETARRRNQDSGMTPATHPRLNTQRRNLLGVLRPDDAAKPTKLHDARRRQPVSKPTRGRRRKREACFLRFYEPSNTPNPPAIQKATTTSPTPTYTCPSAWRAACQGKRDNTVWGQNRFRTCRLALF